MKLAFSMSIYFECMFLLIGSVPVYEFLQYIGSVPVYEIKKQKQNTKNNCFNRTKIKIVKQLLKH